MSYHNNEFPNRKGQIISLDVLLFSLALALIILTFMYVWNFMVVRWDNISSYNQLYLAGLTASELVVETAGNPPSWEVPDSPGQNATLGLVNERNVINKQKLGRFANLSAQNYSSFKKMLGLNSYEVFINVTNLNRTQTYYLIGNLPTDFNETAVFDRYVIFNGSIAVLKLEVWK